MASGLLSLEPHSAAVLGSFDGKNISAYSAPMPGCCRQPERRKAWRSLAEQVPNWSEIISGCL
jgi:hypothetical protein